MFAITVTWRIFAVSVDFFICRDPNGSGLRIRCGSTKKFPGKIEMLAKVAGPRFDNYVHADGDGRIRGRVVRFECRMIPCAEQGGGSGSLADTRHKVPSSIYRLAA